MPLPGLARTPQVRAPTVSLRSSWSEGTAVPLPAGAGRGTAPSVPRSLRFCPEALSERIPARQHAVRGRDLTPPRHAELLPEGVGVSLGGAGRDAEAGADLLVGASGRDELDHLALPLGDARAGTG